MISINYNTEIVLLGGWLDTSIADIWKFSFVNHNWTKLGQLSSGVAQFSSFLVNNIKCP